MQEKVEAMDIKVDVLINSTIVCETIGHNEW